MKNQYFGDINDYRKYGLLRHIIGASKLRVLFAWMLTPDDESSDGQSISYLENPHKWSRYDPILFEKLQDMLGKGQSRRVDLIERTELFPKAEFFSDLVPDTGKARDVWFESLTRKTKSCEFVFLDPDTGLEIKSKPYGQVNSSRYVYWAEVEKLWSLGNSLLIYQHFIRENHKNFIERLLKRLAEATSGSLLEAFSTSHVVFLMALQPEHQQFHAEIINAVQKNWKGQIIHWDLYQTQK